MNCGKSMSLGVYVLGAMDPDERARTERHLEDCPSCRDELGRLAPLPAMLSRLDVNDVAPIVGAPTVAAPFPSGQSSTPNVARPAAHGAWGLRRVRTLVAGAVLAAAVVAAVAVRPVFDNGTPPSSAPAPTSLSAVDTGTGVRATAVLTAQSQGTHVALRLLGVAPGERCHLVIQSGDGHTETSGSWTTSYTGGVEVPVSTSFAPADITGLQVVTADDRILVQLNNRPTG